MAQQLKLDSHKNVYLSIIFITAQTANNLYFLQQEYDQINRNILTIEYYSAKKKKWTENW